ncbi:DASH complex subunit Dad2-domain-containing protein [Pyronema omphalodes]|nr:DASH complex subunit Dad2-domain-containing protein [Pyronema omphalodes]
MSNPKPRYSIAPNRLSGGLGAPPSQLSQPAIAARIEEKRQELESLLLLKDLSGNVARQLSELEEKLVTLADGTEAVAAVLSNWQTILRTIALASTAIPQPKEEIKDDPFTNTPPAKEQEDGFPKDDNGVPMPHVLVRIPVEDQP